MTEKPIIFDANEVNAVLAGCKTQHRIPILTDAQISAGYEWDFAADGDAAIFHKYANDGDSIEDTLLIDCPFGATGDRLWVQEGLKHRQPSNVDCCMQWAYASDNEWALNSGIPVNAHKQKLSAKSMPRWASRLLLEITDIHIERVRGIDVDSAEAEGCFNFSGYERLKPRPLSAFITYWMAKHGDDGWFTNPWVWVIEFKVVGDNKIYQQKDGSHAN